MVDIDVNGSTYIFLKNEVSSYDAYALNPIYMMTDRSNNKIQIACDPNKLDDKIRANNKAVYVYKIVFISTHYYTNAKYHDIKYQMNFR